jgi:serine/threonine protein kinase
MDIGSVLHNRYTLTAKLGKGAMGTVYRADDKQTGQTVAVKIIARDLAFEPDMFARFRREGEALRQLRHPNIVGFVDMFEHDEQHVIVMEYVPGGNLHDLIQRGPNPIVHSLAVDPNDPRRVFAATADGIFRLTSTGALPFVPSADTAPNWG